MTDIIICANPSHGENNNVAVILHVEHMHMKAIAYHIDPKEKEWLVIANYKKHNITFIANKLTLETLDFAVGKRAIILFNHGPINTTIIEGLSRVGIRYIVISSAIKDIDLKTAKKAGLLVVNIPFNKSGEFETMQHVVDKLDGWTTSRGVLG